MIPLIDLTDDVRRELKRRRQPSFWWGVWFGIKLGVLLTIVFFIIVSLCAR